MKPITPQIIHNRLIEHIKDTDEWRQELLDTLKGTTDTILTLDVKIENSIRETDKKLETKVSFKIFTWVLSGLVSFFILIATYLAAQNTNIQVNIIDMQKQFAVVGQDISTIKGKLEPYNVQFKN